MGRYDDRFTVSLGVRIGAGGGCMPIPFAASEIDGFKMIVTGSPRTVLPKMLFGGTRNGSEYIGAASSTSGFYHGSVSSITMSLNADQTFDYTQKEIIITNLSVVAGTFPAYEWGIGYYGNSSLNTYWYNYAVSNLIFYKNGLVYAHYDFNGMSNTAVGSSPVVYDKSGNNRNTTLYGYYSDNRNPQQIWVGGPSGNIDLGDNLSYNLQELYVGTSAGNKRVTRNRQDFTNYHYNTSSSFFPRMAESTAASLTNGEYTAVTNMHYTGWSSYWQDSFDGNNTNYGFVASSTNTTTDWWYGTFTWTTPMWIEKLTLYSANTANWNGVPKLLGVHLRYSGDANWYYLRDVPVNSAYTAAAQARDWTINAQDSRGITGIRLICQNTTTYKTGSYSLRFGELYIFGGTRTTSTGTNWV